MERALEILAQKGQFHLSLELQTKLASRGFTDIVSRSAKGEKTLVLVTSLLPLNLFD